MLSVDYRRPPEHPFPAAPDDVDTVLGWLDRAAADLGVRARRSPTATARAPTSRWSPPCATPAASAAVALIYPFLDPTGGFDSYRDRTPTASARREAAWYWQQYAGSPADLIDPDLAPLLSDRLGTLPPTLVTTAEHDPLRDEGEHLARLLAEAGVEVVATRYLGQVHGFWRHHSVFPGRRAADAAGRGFLRQHR